MPTWRAARRDFRRRQYRRRMQTSAMLGILGAAIFVGQLLLDWAVSSGLLLVYWCGVLALVVWIALLALADMTATHFHYAREKNNTVIEQARLKDELRRARQKDAEAQNGKKN